MVSAHWVPPWHGVTAMEQPPAIHDFNGFPPSLYEVYYPVPGIIEYLTERLSPVSAGVDTIVRSFDRSV